VAYRQPITRVEIEDIRGVDSGAVLKHLLERRLVKIIGRKEEPGRPLLYGTTKEFLTLFSLKDLKSLPTLRDFVELSNEHRAALGLPPMEKGEPQAEEGAPPGEDFLRPDDTTAYTPVGDDEFVQELAEALDELRKRDKRLREWLPLPKEKEEEQSAAPADGIASLPPEAAPPAEQPKPEEGQPRGPAEPGIAGGGEGQDG
jgi:segregation and condensation protein B